MAVSIDFPRAELHDGFRGVPGAFAKTMQAVRVGARGRPAAAGEHHRLRRHRALPRGDGRRSSRAWASCSGRCSSWCRWGGAASSPASRASECERLFEVIYRVQKKEGFVVKVTEAPHYRRHVAQREMKDAGAPSARPDGLAAMPARLTQSEGPGHTVGLAPRGVNSGNGFLFVSHTGEIMPSGFLPIPVGNVRETLARRRLPRDAALPAAAHAVRSTRAAAAAASSATSAAARARAPSASPATPSRPTPGARTSPWRGSDLES